MADYGTILPQDLYPEPENLKILDVRSPSEFARGHIPGAFNLPLFNDEERAAVGTTYIQKNAREALLQGLDIAGKKMRQIVEEALLTSKDQPVVIYCWRGGMRSKSMAWLLNFAGLELKVLKGGYKAYRNMVLRGFTQPEINLLGGFTGSGKSDLLKELHALGEQIIDLEAIAQHRGSAFGGLGKPKQNGSEQFENDLFREWSKLNLSKAVWLEDECFSIGSVNIPYPLYVRMKKADLYFLHVPFETRISQLVEEYGKYPYAELAFSFEKIRKKIGPQNLTLALQHLENKNMDLAAAIALKYYDKSYEKSMKNKSEGTLRIIETGEMNGPEQAKTLMELSRNNKA